MEQVDPKLAELLVKIKGRTEQCDEKPAFNIENFERRQRETLVELSMRRRQLKEVRQELETVKVKNQELQYALESKKRLSSELEDNMKVALENKRMLEKKLKEVCDARIKIVRQNDDLLSENTTLKQSLMQCNAEKDNLLQSVEELKTKNVCNELFRSEIDNQQTKINAAITKTREQMQKLEEDHKGLLVKFKDFDVFNDLLKNVGIYDVKTKKLEQEKRTLEDELICCKGKNIQLVELLDPKHFPINKESVFFFKEWKNNMVKFQEYVQNQDKIMLNLMDNLKREKECNARLIAAQAKPNVLANPTNDEAIKEGEN